MSGIVGIVNLDGQPVDRDLLTRMTGSLTFRGPDQCDVWTRENVGFGHALLRTKADNQIPKPLSLDGKVWLTAHARIDGQQELTAKLSASIPTLEHNSTPSDDELILLAYQVWGKDCLLHLIGDFAFAIWDGPKQQLFCARDQMGIAQFYFAATSNTFVFSNTLNCLRLHPAVSSSLNEVVVGDYLLFGLNQDEVSTVFSDIQRLPKSHSLLLKSGEVRTNRYWAPSIEPVHYKSNPEYIERFKELLDTSVADRLTTTDVAIPMSGGLDSSMIAATARSCERKSSGKLNLAAYCVTYEGAFFDDEREFASQVAGSLEIPIEFLDAASINREPNSRTSDHAPEPFDVDPFYVVSDELMNRMSAHSRVALTGWDGDTFMSETPRHLFHHLWRTRRIGKLSIEMLRYMYFQHTPPPIGVRTWWQHRNASLQIPAFPNWINEEFVRKLNLVDRWKQFGATQSMDHSTRPSAFRTLNGPMWNALFARFDPGVTRLPLEIRHPLLDLRLVNYLLGLPVVPWTIGKRILREAARGILPEAVRRRNKTPLSGDPGMALRSSTKVREIDSFRPTPELADYVQRDAVPPLTTEIDSNALWMNVRPFSLNEWLSYYHNVDLKSPVALNDKNRKNSHKPSVTPNQEALHKAQAG